MSDTRLDNQLLELAYDELDDASAATLCARLEGDDDARARYEAMRQTRDAFAVLDGDSDDAGLSPTARANVLRQARIVAAERADAERRRAPAWLPALAAVATLALVAAGVWLVVGGPRSQPAEDAARSGTEEVVASGVEHEPEPMARLDTPPPAEEAETVPQPPEPALAPTPSAVAEAPRVEEDLAPPVEEPEPAAAAAPTRTEPKAKAKAKAPADEPDLPRRLVEKRASGAASGLAGSAAPAEQAGQPDGNDNLQAELGISASNSAEAPLAQPAEDAPLATALAAYQQGRYADAIELLTPLVAADAPATRATALYHRGLSRQHLGDHLGAVKDLRVLVESHEAAPELDAARFALATSLEASGNPNDARTHYELLAASASGFAADAQARLDAMASGGVSAGSGNDSAAARSKRKRSKKGEAPARSKKKSAPTYDAIESDDGNSGSGSVVY